MRALLFSAVLIFAAAPVAAAESKPRIIADANYSEEVTSLPVPGKKGATYVIRRVVNCRNAKGECDPDPATSRLRLEDTTGFGKQVFYDTDLAEKTTIQIGWVVTPSLYLTKRKPAGSPSERVVIVSLPDGGVVDQDTYGTWLFQDVWSAPSAAAFLVAAYSETGPMPLSLLEKDGRISRIENSDWKRLRNATSGHPDCAMTSLDAAFPPESLLESIPGRPFAELHRRASVGGNLVPPDMSVGGSPEEVCARFASHFWIGKLSDGRGWQALGSGGSVLAGGAVFAAPGDAERAGIAAKNAAQNLSAAAVAQAELVRQRDLDFAARREQALAELRPKVDALWKAGTYDQAVAAAEGLTPEEYASYIWFSPVATQSQYESGLKKLKDYGAIMSSDPWAAKLQARLDAMRACEARRSPPLQAKSRWESLSPYDQSMIVALGPPGGYVPGPDERWVFDATKFEWLILSGAGSSGGGLPDVINVPRTNAQTPDEVDRLEAAYQVCMDAARRN